MVVRLEKPVSETETAPGAEPAEAPSSRLPLLLRPAHGAALVAALERLKAAEDRSAGQLEALMALVRSLPERPVGEVDPAQAAVSLALDVLDGWIDGGVDETAGPPLLWGRALLLARVDACPVRALDRAMDEALSAEAGGRERLWDARGGFHLRGGRWKEALRCYRSARIYGGHDSTRLWRTASAAVAAPDPVAAMEAFRLLGVPVRLSQGERPRSSVPERLRVRASLRLPIPGLVTSVSAFGRALLDLDVEATSPVHGPLLEPIDGDLPLRIGDVLVWDRSGSVPGSPLPRVIGRVRGAP